jgi:hypothetical protein
MFFIFIKLQFTYIKSNLSVHSSGSFDKYIPLGNKNQKLDANLHHFPKFLCAIL